MYRFFSLLGALFNLLLALFVVYLAGDSGFAGSELPLLLLLLSLPVFNCAFMTASFLRARGDATSQAITAFLCANWKFLLVYTPAVIAVFLAIAGFAPNFY